MSLQNDVTIAYDRVAPEPASAPEPAPEPMYGNATTASQYTTDQCVQWYGATAVYRPTQLSKAG